MYISVNLKKNKIILIWPIQIFKIFANLFNSIMVIPFLEIFFSILNCPKLKLTFSDINCYQNSYIAHCLFASIGIIIVLFFSFVFGKFYFDIKKLSNNLKNRENSNHDFSQLIMKIIFILCFEFVTDLLDSQKIVISLVLLIGSSYLFFLIWIGKPFFFTHTQKVF